MQLPHRDVLLITLKRDQSWTSWCKWRASSRLDPPLMPFLMSLLPSEKPSMENKSATMRFTTSNKTNVPPKMISETNKSLMPAMSWETHPLPLPDVKSKKSEFPAKTKWTNNKPSEMKRDSTSFSLPEKTNKDTSREEAKTIKMHSTTSKKLLTS